MGMSPAEFRRFVVTWRERLETASAGLRVTAEPSEMRKGAETDPGEWMPASGAALSRPVLDSGPEGPVTPSDQVQDAESPVSPRFRPIVEAYFEQLARWISESREPEQ